MVVQAERARAGARAPRRVRDVSLDRLRGLAILLMVLDHLLIVTGHETSPVRYTVTRAAMPLFFVLAGHLATRALTRRHAYVLALGIGLPLVVPFIDRPNVLVFYVLSVPVIVACRRLGPAALGLLAVVPLSLSANGFDLWPWASAYDPTSLLGLMALGALLPRQAFRAGGRLPAWVGPIGRRPVTWYAGHLLVLVAVSHLG